MTDILHQPAESKGRWKNLTVRLAGERRGSVLARGGSELGFGERDGARVVSGLFLAGAQEAQPAQLHQGKGSPSRSADVSGSVLAVG